MDTIRIVNLRSLKDTKSIRLQPINLLVGENSSGKSTFLRFFPLLKQSVETQTVGPILWYSNLVDFGSFKEALNRGTNSKTIVFEFSYTLNLENQHNFRISRKLKSSSTVNNFEINISLTLEQTSKQEFSKLKQISMKYLGNEVNIELAAQEKLTKLQINSRDFTDLFANLHFIQRGSLLPMFSRNRMVHSSSNDFKFAPSVRKKLSDEIKEISRIRTQTSIDRVINKLKLGSHEEMLKMLKGISPTKTWENNISELNTDHPTFLLIYDLTIAAFFEGIYELTSYQLSDFAHNVNYIAPLRASAERYYRVQGLAVREVDAQGQNLAMFLRNLSPDRKKKLNYWLAENFDFELEAPLDGGHLSLKLKQLTTNELFNLADMGFGFSQMIPILVQLWMISTGRHLRRFRGTPFIFAIEQPELHLHPRLQAKLADIFMSTITTAKKMNIDLRLVLETHSETMINHFGNKIAQGVFDHNDINVILFEKDPSVTYSNVMETGYDEEGFLKQWPYGFFEPED